eukprot:gene17303-20596_t
MENPFGSYMRRDLNSQADNYVADKCEADTYVVDNCEADNYVADNYEADNYVADNYEADDYVADNYEADNYVADNYMAAHHESALTRDIWKMRAPENVVSVPPTCDPGGGSLERAGGIPDVLRWAGDTPDAPRNLKGGRLRGRQGGKRGEPGAPSFSGQLGYALCPYTRNARHRLAGKGEEVQPVVDVDVAAAALPSVQRGQGASAHVGELRGQPVVSLTTVVGVNNHKVIGQTWKLWQPAPYILVHRELTLAWVLALACMKSGVQTQPVYVDAKANTQATSPWFREKAAGILRVDGSMAWGMLKVVRVYKTGRFLFM